LEDAHNVAHLAFAAPAPQETNATRLAEGLQGKEVAAFSSLWQVSGGPENLIFALFFAVFGWHS
jgi:hypothetical protein